MFGWVTSWWSAGSFTGPARNAPNDGKNIKELFDQRPKQVMILTQEQVVTIRKNLRKTQTNATPPLSQKPPIMAELDTVFGQGNDSYFDMVRKRRELAKLNAKSSVTDSKQETQQETKDPVELGSDEPKQEVVESNIKEIVETMTNCETISDETKVSDCLDKESILISVSKVVCETNNVVISNEVETIQFTQEEVAAEADEFQDM